MAEPITEDIRRTLAEFMGYRRSEKWPDSWLHPDGEMCDWTFDYDDDLNAMHEVEERICASERSVEYARALCLQARASHVNLISSWGPLWPYIHATAEQRARAAYHVIKEYFNG